MPPRTCNSGSIISSAEGPAPPPAAPGGGVAIAADKHRLLGALDCSRTKISKLSRLAWRGPPKSAPISRTL